MAAGLDWQMKGKRTETHGPCVKNHFPPGIAAIAHNYGVYSSRIAEIVKVAAAAVDFRHPAHGF
jgi:aspartate aminotransferase-like enzyme